MNRNPYSLVDRQILITGGTSGIGRATAIAAYNLGARVCVIGRDENKLASLRSEIDGKDLKTFKCDINDTSQVESILNELPNLDGVVFCAGTLNSVSIKHMDRDHLDDVFETNFFSTIHLVTSLLAKKIINKYASLVFISSIAANNIAEPGMACYGSSKAAISSFARILAVELSKKKIRVNCVKPGIVRTTLLKNFELDEEDFALDEKKYPFGYGYPEDVAYAITYLLSNAARWVTGSEIILDGGRTLR